MLINIIIMPIFLFFLFISLKFIFGSEGQDERGKHITTTSYMYSFPLFPIGWLVLETYYKYIGSINFTDYRNYLGLLIPVTFIVQGFVILFLKRKI